MKNDLTKIRYISGPTIDQDVVDTLMADIRFIASDCFGYKNFLDSKEVSIKWITNESAVEAFNITKESLDESPFNVIELKYKTWSLTEKFSALYDENIECYFNSMYIFKPDAPTSDISVVGYYIHEILVEHTEGNIESTELSEDGILSLLEKIEEELMGIGYEEFIEYEFPGNLHPRVKSLHKKIHSKLLKEQQEYDLQDAQNKLEKDRIELEINKDPHWFNIEMTVASKLRNYYFDLQLSFYGKKDRCTSLKITARPRCFEKPVKLNPIWTKTISIPPISLAKASRYLQNWILDNDNIETLKSFHLQPQDNQE